MRTVLAVAALLLTAGCAGVGVPGDDVSAPTADSGYPPGVTENGIQNATRLVDAHVTNARSAGYEFRLDREERIDGGDDSTQQPELRRVRCYGQRTTDVLERECEMTESAADGSNESVARTHLWANQSVSLQRHESERNVSYSLRRSQLDEYPDQWAWPTFSPVFEGSYDVQRRFVVDGRTYVLLVDDGSSFSSLPVNASMTSRLVVDMAGRIHELDATVQESDPEAESFTWTMAYDLTALGVERIAAPEWRDEAYSLDAIDLRAEGGRYLLTVTHESGVPVPEGSTLRITHDGRVTELTLEEPLGRHDQLAVAFRTADLRPVLVDVDEFERRGHVGVSGEYYVELVALDGTRLLDGGQTVEMSFGKDDPPL